MGMILSKQDFFCPGHLIKDAHWSHFSAPYVLFTKHLFMSLTCPPFFLADTLTQDVVARHQNSCLQAGLVCLQVYRSKSSRQHKVWQMVLQILALTQNLQDRGPCQEGHGSCITRSMSWTHLHLCSESQHQNWGQRGSRQSKQVLELPAFGS